MAKPSKTPWVWNTYQRVGAKHPITGEPIQDSGFYLTSPPGFYIAHLPITSSMDGETQGANARLIVQAVNSHARLVEALEEWYRLYCLKGIDRTLRNRMKQYAANLTREALRLAKKS